MKTARKAFALLVISAPAAFVLFVLIAWVIALSGCNVKTNTPIERTSPAAAIGDLKTKDAETVDAAGKIDAANVSNPEPARAAISAQTASIFDLVRLNPAQRAIDVISAITAERDAALVSVAKLQEQLDKADLKTTRLIRVGFAGASGLLGLLTVAAGLMVAKTGAVFFGLGRDIVIGLGLLSALSLFISIAYGWAARHQGLFSAVGACIILAVCVLFYANMRREKMDRIANLNT